MGGLLWNGYSNGHCISKLYLMLRYRCNKCRLLFENSIVQSRCPTFKCQSRQIKELPDRTPMGQDVLNFGLEEVGVENQELRNKQGRHIREAQYKYEEELLSCPRD